MRLLGICVGIALCDVGAIRAEPLMECRERSGLPNFFDRIEAGEPNTVRVAFLGGSITAQEGWRPKILSWVKQQARQSRVEEINAAIGGTGSDLGVFRLEQDVLIKEPDLVFIEFAVNDSGAAPEQIHRCMEGIVRKIWKQDPTIDICFVYTLAGNMLDTLKRGEAPRSVAAMEQIAEHYGIPSINMGLEIARLESAGLLVFKGELPKKRANLSDASSQRTHAGDPQSRAAETTATERDPIVFSPDGVHPYPETGHQIYFEVLVRSLEKIRKTGGRETLRQDTGASRPVGMAHALPAPFAADNWEAARMVPLSLAKLSPGWQGLDATTNGIARQFKNRLPKIWKATQPGESVSFQFRGATARIYDLVGPDCGQVIVKVDDGPPVVRPRFDAYCTYHRLATMSIAEGLPDTVHRVELTIHPEQPDKAKILSQRNEKMDNPMRYDGTAWYAGAILLVGEMVE